jgi:tetratricopeptide (TPR) repeat protein
VLLQKGLYRSALPLLKRVVVLQPYDARMKSWLEQTQSALSGGPAPVLGTAEEQRAQQLARQDAPVISKGRTTGEITQVVRISDVPGAPTLPADPPRAPLPEELHAAIQDPSAPLPFDAGAEGHAVDVSLRISGTLDELSRQERTQLSDPTEIGSGRLQNEPPPVADWGLLGDAAGLQLAPEEVGRNGTAEPFAPVPESHLPPASRPTPPESPTASAGPPVLYPAGQAAPPAEPAAPEPASTAGAPPRPPPLPAPSLLEDIPHPEEVAPPPVELPKVELSTQARYAIAQEYERELRQKLAEKVVQHERSFLARNWVKLGLASVVFFAILVGVGIYWSTRIRHRGEDLKTRLAHARKEILKDTEKSYRSALEALGQAVEMEPSHAEAWALMGYAKAILATEHGAGSELKAEAAEALGRPEVREKFPGLYVSTRYLLADPQKRAEAREAVLKSDGGANPSEVASLAGRILLERKDIKAALERFDGALKANPANVRALVALGSYSREALDFGQALDLYKRAQQVSPEHAEAVIGAAECRLELGLQDELPAALREVEALPTGDKLSPVLLVRRELTHGRLLAATGSYEPAIQRLSEGVRTFRNRAFEFNLALGEACQAAGQLDRALRAFEAAVSQRPRSEDARESLGRALIASDREREVPVRLAADADQRRLALVRGIAYARLKDWRRARLELHKTAVDRKFPTEAVVYLALADAAEGKADKAQELLEQTLATAKRSRSELRVGLGQIYLQRGLIPKAKEQFEEAMKDARDHEGACALGRLLLSQGQVEEAVTPLTLAVTRNGFHGEARGALGRAKLELGQVTDALAQYEAWQQASPPSAAGQRDWALALLHAGRVKEAQQTLARALKLDAADPPSHRVKALIEFASGDGRMAMQSLMRANRLNPRDAETFCEIGNAFLRSGNGANAARAFAAAQKLVPASVCAAVGMHASRLPSGTRGAARELTELSGKAKRVWERAWAKATLARVYLALGSLKDARKAAEDAVAAAPTSAVAQLSLGLVALRQRDDEAARAALTQAASLDPSHGPAQMALADFYAKGGPEEAAKAYEAYQTFLRIGGGSAEEAKARRALVGLKKKLAQR